MNHVKKYFSSCLILKLIKSIIFTKILYKINEIFGMLWNDIYRI